MKGKLRAYVNKKFQLYPKTIQIIELREELYSMMCDKYDDCRGEGLSEAESYKKALTIMNDYKTAINEVETGSAFSALKKRISSLLAFTALFFAVLIAVYLYVSLVRLGSFEQSWLIGVGGAFIYLVIVAVSLLSYAKKFKMPVFYRVSLGSIFLSLIPLLFVLPSLLSEHLFSTSVWATSWLIVPAVVLIYLVADLILFGKNNGKIMLSVELVVTGAVLSTVIYLVTSFYYNVWDKAWIIYVVYLAVIALVFFIMGKVRQKS